MTRYRRLRCALCGVLTRDVTRTALATVCTGCVEVMLERTLADVQRAVDAVERVAHAA